MAVGSAATTGRASASAPDWYSTLGSAGDAMKASVERKAVTIRWTDAQDGAATTKATASAAWDRARQRDGVRAPWRTAAGGRGSEEEARVMPICTGLRLIGFPI